VSTTDDLLRNAESYAASFDKGDLPMPPARKLAVLACMDARLNPYALLGLQEGDAHIIRNAGGLVTDDVLRSLIISYWGLGTREVVVIAHENCGLLTFSNQEIHERLAQETGHDATGIDFLPFDDLDGAVRASMGRIRESPFLPDSYGLAGFVYDVGTGAMREVREA
jgi:carbonic anhydrase